jgi:putative CocE/NonD family hydrolase
MAAELRVNRPPNIRGVVRVRTRLALVVAAAAVTTMVAVPSDAADHARGWKPRPATYGVTVTNDVPITMSDGTVLSANVFRPARPDGTAAPGRFPTLLVQTPYNKDSQDPHSDYLVKRGYVDVVVDVRGAGSSGGTFDSWGSRQQTDSKELVAWAAAQPWSSGRVGLHGESWYAINQLLTAAQQPPALKAIFPVVPTGDNYRSVLPGGYLTSLFVFDLLDPLEASVPPRYTASDPMRAAETLGSRPSSINNANTYNVTTLSGGSGAYDGPYYRSTSPLWLIDRIKTPTFLVGGWFDALSQRDAPLLLQELQRRHVPAKLLMGPWYHTTAGAGLAEQGLLDLDALQLRWFDHWVVGVPGRELDTSPPVTYQRLGEDRFHTAPSWPVPGVRYERLSLSGSGMLRRGPGTGAADVLPWQPASGACTRSTYIGTFGLVPSTPCETDDSVNDRTGLTYDLPVTRTVDLTGPMSAHLYVSTTSTDAFVTLHVEDVDPATGRAEELTSGWDSLSFRALDRRRTTRLGDAGLMPFHPYTKESVEQIASGRIYDWWIEIRPVAARIKAGHVLRLSLQPADAVRFLPTAPALKASAGAVLSIYHDAKHPSSLVIPTTP